MEISAIAGLSVLVVEDMYLIGASLAAGLEQAGAHVIGPIGTVREALAALDPLPDLATLDIQLDRETSFPVADELVRLGIPFVFATATGSSIPAAHRERIVCAKPYTIIAILTALHRALAGAGISNPPVMAATIVTQRLVLSA
ncbi:response regulator [Sphingomonas mollis]|uniref:Response regulator n=1 Tax=Sphingomonas mollis TaxID=2795726 RepID=A0ABS0XU98_9SPHN|nr:response regulator [Sphingomonas sp. BT553]MBJ6123305.1 response regulator [Sphingomonas sp. BT553]